MIGYFMEKLPEPQKSAVEMCSMKKMTFDEAAEWFTAQRGIKTDRKTVWRWNRRGLKMLERMLHDAKWTSELGDIPR